MKRGQPLARKSRLSPVSAKRRAHKAAEREAGGIEHMMRVKALGCLICHDPDAEAHHLPGQRSAFRTIPLCPRHHRAEYGPQAYHYSRRNFNARHGSDEDLLIRTMDMLGK